MGYRINVGQDDVPLQANFTDLGSVVITGYSWSSTDTAIATVTAGTPGLATLHPVAAGTCNIQVTANVFTGSPLTATFPVQVMAKGAAAVHITAIQPPSQEYPNDAAGPGGGGQIPSPGNQPE